MMHKLEFRAMGCHMFAALDSPSAARPEQLEQIPAWFETWEQSLSRFRNDSELSRLNRDAGQATQVSAELAEVFENAINMEQFSAGLVTPVILSALELAGYNRSFDQLATHYSNHVEAPVMSLPCLSDVTWDAPNRTICFPPEIQLDFGGIAKGWAAQRAAARLSVHGPALVNAGGDIAISRARRNGQAWEIGVTNPFEPDDTIVVIQLQQGGVATSGKDYRRWLQNGIWKHHIIDPRTGQPALTDVLTATAIAPTTVEAEAAAKMLLIMGSRAGMQWLETQPGLAGLLVLEDGQCLASRSMENYIRS